MELKGITCPKCGSQLNFTEDQDFCFCSHCGTQVYKEDSNKASFTYRTIDEAKIKEAENKAKELEFKDKQAKRKLYLTLFIIGVVVAFLIFIIIVYFNLYKKYGTTVFYATGFSLLMIGELIVLGIMFSKKRDDSE